MMRAGTSSDRPMYGSTSTRAGRPPSSGGPTTAIALAQTIPLGLVGLARLPRDRHAGRTTASPAQTYVSALTSADGVTWTPVLGSTQVLIHGHQLPGRPGRDSAAPARPPSRWSSTNVDAGRGDHAAAGGLPGRLDCGDIGGPGVPPGNQLASGGHLDACRASGGHLVGLRRVPLRLPDLPVSGQSPTGTARSAPGSTSQTGGGPWMRSGVMIRSGTDAQAPYYGVFITPGQRRGRAVAKPRAAQTHQVSESGIAAPRCAWRRPGTPTRLRRRVLRAYCSTDGVNWSYVPGSTVALNLPGPLVAGLASDANSSTQPRPWPPSTLVAQQARRATAPVPLPDRVDAAPTWAARCPPARTRCSGSWTETAGGGDIWGTSDSFHLVAQSLAADGTVTARVSPSRPPAPGPRPGPWSGPPPTPARRTTGSS